MGTAANPKYSTFDQRTLTEGFVAATSKTAARVHSVKATSSRIKGNLPVAKRCHPTNTARIAVVNPVRIKINSKIDMSQCITNSFEEYLPSRIALAGYYRELTDDLSLYPIIAPYLYKKRAGILVYSIVIMTTSFLELSFSILPYDKHPF